MVGIVERRMIAPNLHVLTVHAPDVAEAAEPGMFVILRPADDGERIPLTIADWDATAGSVSSVFSQVGASTARLARLRAGDTIPSYAGPLGRPTEIASFGTVLLVGGCYGVGSIYPIARALTAAGNHVIAVLEARSAYLLFWEDRTERRGRAAHRRDTRRQPRAQGPRDPPCRDPDARGHPPGPRHRPWLHVPDDGGGRAASAA